MTHKLCAPLYKFHDAKKPFRNVLVKVKVIFNEIFALGYLSGYELFKIFKSTINFRKFKKLENGYEKEPYCRIL